jgi:hypothetical protein
MPRPITWLFSSRRIALVVVEPRSMPTKVFISSPLSGGTRADALFSLPATMCRSIQGFLYIIISAAI